MIWPVACHGATRVTSILSFKPVVYVYYSNNELMLQELVSSYLHVQNRQSPSLGREVRSSLLTYIFLVLFILVGPTGIVILKKHLHL